MRYIQKTNVQGFDKTITWYTDGLRNTLPFYNKVKIEYGAVVSNLIYTLT